MTSPNTISPRTNIALLEAATKYSDTVEIPCYLDGVDGFANSYLGMDESESKIKILITGDNEHLAVSVDGTNGESKAFVNIDLVNPDGEPASIVEPGLYDESGKRDAEKGKFARPILRPLTEREGLELTMDLYSIMSKIPIYRRKK